MSEQQSPNQARPTGPDRDRPELSLIIPIFDEESVLEELLRRLAAFLPTLATSWEVVFVDDGSQDHSLDKLKALGAGEPRYRIVALSRNFGHQLAISAGFDYARGDAVVVLDADLQDPPEVVADMLARYREGYDVVHAVRRRLVLTLRALRESSRFVRGMVAWVGFRQTTVPYDRHSRFAGRTHYPVRRMLRFAFDGIAAFSVVPLRVATWLGTLSGLAAIAVAIWALYGRLYGRFVPGWATIMITVSLGASAQLLMTGILGEYIGRIYEEVKRRPLYIVAEEVNAARDASRDGHAPASHRE